MIKIKYEYGETIQIGNHNPIRLLKTQCPYKKCMVSSATCTDDCIFFLMHDNSNQTVTCTPDDVIVVEGYAR